MKNNFSNKKPARRQFLAGAAALSAGSAAATSASSNGDPLITEVQDWAQSTGDGVDVWNWSNCADSSEIVFYLTKDGGHSWPMGIAPRRRADQPSEVINANELMWDFFKTHPKQ